MDAYIDALAAMDKLIAVMEQPAPTKKFRTDEGEVVYAPSFWAKNKLIRLRSSEALSFIEKLPQMEREISFLALKKIHDTFREYKYRRDDVAVNDLLAHLKEEREVISGNYDRDKRYPQSYRPKSLTKIRATKSHPSDALIKFLLSENPNAGYGWPAKVSVAAIITAAWVVAFPYLAAAVVPKVEHSTAYALSLLATSLTAFFGLIALSNTVSKP